MGRIYNSMEVSIMSNEKMESMAEVEKMLEEISKNGVDNFSHKELVYLNKLIILIKKKTSMLLFLI